MYAKQHAHDLKKNKNKAQNPILTSVFCILIAHPSSSPLLLICSLSLCKKKMFYKL